MKDQGGDETIVLTTKPDQAGICSRSEWFGVLLVNSTL